MRTMCNPVNKKGKRNTFCPYYGDCLDFVIENSWKYWDCCNCPHRLNEGARVEIEFTTSDSIECYDLPLEVYREIG